MILLAFICLNCIWDPSWRRRGRNGFDWIRRGPYSPPRVLRGGKTCNMPFANGVSPFINTPNPIPYTVCENNGLYGTRGFSIRKSPFVRVNNGSTLLSDLNSTWLLISSSVSFPDFLLHLPQRVSDYLIKWWKPRAGMMRNRVFAVKVMEVK